MGMFVQVGCTYDMHRAHVVRGVLEAHGVPAEVWHESPLIGDFVPGWLGCFVVVREDEYDAAVEVLNTRPEEIPEQDGTGEIPSSYQKYPGFVDYLIFGALLPLIAGVVVMLGKILGQLEPDGSAGSYSTEAGDPVEVLKFFVITVPSVAVCFACLSVVCMAPLSIYKESRWLGMIAYVWVRCLLFVLLPATLAWLCSEGSLLGKLFDP